MKIIYTILSFFAINANATNYYVSNAGSDGNNGTSTGTSWQTLAKVNGFTFASGDSILLKCGDTWNEKIIVPHASIIFSSYSTGNKPIITAFQSLGGFSQSGNIWTATATNAVKVLTTVILNGVFAYKARYPNSTYITPIGPFTNTSVTTTLPDVPSYVGNEIVVRSTQWVLDVRKVTSQSSGVFGLSQNLTYAPTLGGRGIFFQNGSALIDSVGEFSFDSASKSISVYSVSSPTVQISTIDTLVLVNHKDNVTFNNISFTGANMYTFKIDTSHNFIVKNCSINYCGNIGIYASKSRNITIDRDSIINCYNSGIILGSEYVGSLGIITDTCKKATVTNNVIRKSGIVAGMAANGLYRGDGEITHYGAYVAGDSAVVKYNVFDSSGYCNLRFIGRGDSICYNYSINHGFIKVDAGSIYTYQGSSLSPSYNLGTVIYRNIVGNGVGTTLGIINTNIAPGIYGDLYTNGITIKENTVFNCLGGSLFFLTDSNMIVRDNNFEDSVDFVMRIDAGRNFTLSNNVFYQRNSAKTVFTYNSAVTQTSDSNYFLRPVAPTSLISYNSRTYSFPHLYQDSTGYDLHSNVAPSDITSNVGRLYINPSQTDSNINIGGTFIDARGRIVFNTLTLAPYTSRILFPMPYTISGSLSNIPIFGIR